MDLCCKIWSKQQKKVTIMVFFQDKGWPRKKRGKYVKQGFKLIWPTSKSVARQFLPNNNNEVATPPSRATPLSGTPAIGVWFPDNQVLALGTKRLDNRLLGLNSAWCLFFDFRFFFGSLFQVMYIDFLIVHIVIWIYVFLPIRIICIKILFWKLESKNWNWNSNFRILIWKKNDRKPSAKKAIRLIILRGKAGFLRIFIELASETISVSFIFWVLFLVTLLKVHSNTWGRQGKTVIQLYVSKTVSYKTYYLNIRVT